MPIWDRDWYRNWFFKGKHPPTCTCVKCTKIRLRKSHTKHSAAIQDITPAKIPKPGLVAEKDMPHKSDNKISNWVLSLLLIFAISVGGVGISIFVGSFIPLWVLLGFSLIFSIEKWFSYQTRRHKSVGKLYRLLLNLTMLAVLGLIIWSGIKLFSQQYFSSPLVGSLIFLAELVFFIWMWRTVSKNSWRWPSMKLTVFLLVCMAVIFTFAGVPPLSTYKDNLITKWEDYQAEQAAQQAEIEAEEAARVEAARQEQLNVEQAKKEAEEAARVEAARQEQLISVDDFAMLINEYRQSYGLSVLTFTDDLNKRASLRLSELELDYSHNSLGNYNLHLAENILWASYTLDNNEAFMSWKASPGHNANILDASYKYTGYAIGGGYAIQLFSEYPTINGEPQLPPGWYWID